MSEVEREAFAARLKARIRDAGPISIADYMNEVARFYYASRDPFGVGGDFTTTPEISQVFGELIGAWCAELWQRLGAPDPVLLVELGPGRGTLMADALRAARVLPSFLRAARLHLVERSPRLRKLQAAALAAHAPRFHETIAVLPPGPMLLVANEFFDALPIRQFEVHDGAWHERKIGLDRGGAFAFLLEQARCHSPNLPRAGEGAIKEIRPAARTLAQAIAQRIVREGGAALIIDYGYYPSAVGDTLQAVRRHHPHPILVAPGSADLTAHVDFAAIADAAREAGAACYGPATQGGFLTALGIAAREAALLEAARPTQRESIRAGVKRLVHPAEMGALFKVLALGRRGAPAPEGFGAA